jgi:hypothetical protein
VKPTIAAALALVACRAPDVSVGARLPRDAGRADAPVPCAATTGAIDRLPFGLVDAAALPASVELGGRRFARVLVEGFDGTDAIAATALTSGAGAYPSSLSEFSPDALVIAGGRLHMQVRRKDVADAGATDRAYWGSEVLSRQAYAHGLFMARLRARGAPQVQLSFFLTHDKIAPGGASLGWTGPLFNFFGDEAAGVDVAFHDSASGRHDSVTAPVAGGVDADHVYAVLAEPAHVAFFVDGARVHEWRDAETESPWTVHLTHWIVQPNAATFDGLGLPTEVEVDFLGAYALDGCS